MIGPRRIGGYVEVAFSDPEEIVAAWIKVFCCEKCGFTELYREEKQARRESESKEALVNSEDDE